MSRDAQQGGAQQEQRDAESCARADAQHVGAGQRVAEKGLHFEAAGSEGRAGEQGRDGFQKPDLEDDVADGRVARAARERRPDVAERHGDRSHGEVGDEKRRGEQPERREEERGSACCHLAVPEFERDFVTEVAKP